MSAGSDNVEVVRCPGCGRRVATAAPCVKSFYDPAFHCACGLTGVLVWKRGAEAVVRGGKVRDGGKS